MTELLSVDQLYLYALYQNATSPPKPPLGEAQSLTVSRTDNAHLFSLLLIVHHLFSLSLIDWHLKTVKESNMCSQNYNLKWKQAEIKRKKLS